MSNAMSPGLLPRIARGGTCHATSAGDREGRYIELTWLGFCLHLAVYGRLS